MFVGERERQWLSEGERERRERRERKRERERERDGEGILLSVCYLMMREVYCV